MSGQTKPIICAITIGILAGLLLTGTASAHKLSPGRYQDKLDRCVEAVRTQLGASDSTQMRHIVTDIDRRSAWYVFSIHSEVMDAGDEVKQTVVNRCKAHRWDNDTMIEMRAT